jgi:hypothetical protein
MYGQSRGRTRETLPPIESTNRHSRSLWWVVLALCIAVGFAARVVNLDAQSLWLDEAMFVEAAGASTVTETIEYMGHRDIHPPLYALLLRGWIHLVDSSDFSVRLLSVFFGLLLIPSTAWLALVLTERRDVALLSAGIVALGGYHVFLSQECRHYTWLALIGTLNVIALVKFVRRGTWVWLAGFTGSMLAGTLSHYNMFFFMAGALLFSLLGGRRKQIAAAIAVSFAVFLLLWLAPLLDQIARRSSWGEGLLDPLTGPGQVVRVVSENVYWTVIDFSTGSYLLLAGDRGFDPVDLFKAAALLVFLLMAGFGLIQFWQNRERSPVHSQSVLLFFGLLPVAGVIAMGFHQANVYDTKYVSLVSPLWAVVVGTGSARFLKGASGRVAIALAVVALLVSLSRYHSEAIPWKEDWRGAGAILQENRRSGDVMLQRMNYMAFCLDRYLPSPPPRLLGGQSFLPDSSVVDSVYAEFVGRGANRLWSVASHDEYGSLMLELMAERFQRVSSWTPRGITITLFLPLPIENARGEMAVVP